MLLMVFNVGSSSIKVSIFERSNDKKELEGRLNLQVSGIGARRDCVVSVKGETDGRSLTFARHIKAPVDALEPILSWLDRQGIGIENVAGIGHRIVHGGAKFSQPVKVGRAVRRALGQLQALAPLHMPAGLAVLDAIQNIRPKLTNIACFDTAFHANQPAVATRLPLPARFAKRGYRRYGFHGLSYEHVVAELPRRIGGPLPPRIIALHLGNGSSACAISSGRGVATTMGYSALDGLVMGTRTGSLDPGVIVSLMRNERLSVDDLEDLLYRQSGLLGVSGITSDMRRLTESTDDASRFAVDYYGYWAARHVGGLAAALGGVDAMVFTGGIGENSFLVRSKIASHLDWLGVDLDRKRNSANATKISSDHARIAAYIVNADEEAVIARYVMGFLVSRPPSV